MTRCSRWNCSDTTSTCSWTRRPGDPACSIAAAHMTTGSSRSPPDRREPPHFCDHPYVSQTVVGVPPAGGTPAGGRRVLVRSGPVIIVGAAVFIALTCFAHYSHANSVVAFALSAVAVAL